MKKVLAIYFTIISLFFITGCASDFMYGYFTERLPSEDLEVLDWHADLIAILKSPEYKSNSKIKYDAIKKFIKVVDLTYTRETKTINDIFYHGDAIIDMPNAETRNITFNYQYGNHYVRITFTTFRYFVLRVNIQEQ
jgi:hypothetical protein